MLLWMLQYPINPVQAFTAMPKTQMIIRSFTSLNLKETSDLETEKDMCNKDRNRGNHIKQPAQSRREAMKSASSALLALSLTTPESAEAFNFNPFTPEDQISNGGIYQPAKRATAYLVDSTIPPTLVPFRASREAAILKKIGSGSGTQKSPYIEEKLTLNNIMNKSVFGTIDFVKGVVGEGNDDAQDGAPQDDKKKKAFDASFVFLGVDYNDSTKSDTDLAIGLMTDIIKPRRGLDSALALGFVPISLQPALDTYLSSTSSEAENNLKEALVKDGKKSQNIFENQLPLIQFAKSKQLPLIACAPEVIDAQTVRTEGLQNVNEERRANYVIDAEGFIAWTQDPKSRLYAEKSLLKDFIPMNEKDAPGNFFAEKILQHETMATAIAKYAMRHPKTVVMAIAPISDVRYLGGPNGRLPRVCKVIKSDTNIDEEAVTTILLNPSAEETLSKSKFLRLEIGTAPKLLQYQTKVADYLWFSSMPKVNMIPRLMNGN